MLRLFVGLPLPAEIRSSLMAQMHGVPDVRWQTDNQLHLTLRFIGNVEEHVAHDVDLVLQATRFDPFDLALDGTGLFGTLKKPRILWAGVTKSAQLAALAQKIDTAMVQIGLPPEQHKFSPHVTLARCNRRTSRIDRFLESSAALTSPAWTVDHFALFRSHLGHQGAHYEAVARYDAANGA